MMTTLKGRALQDQVNRTARENMRAQIARERARDSERGRLVERIATYALLLGVLLMVASMGLGMLGWFVAAIVSIIVGFVLAFASFGALILTD